MECRKQKFAIDIYWRSLLLSFLIYSYIVLLALDKIHLFECKLILKSTIMKFFNFEQVGSKKVKKKVYNPMVPSLGRLIPHLLSNERIAAQESNVASIYTKINIFTNYFLNIKENYLLNI